MDLRRFLRGRRETEPPGPIQGRHMLGGRAYVAIGNSTIEHDFFLMGLIRSSGSTEFTLDREEPLEDFAVRVLQEVLARGKMFELLGCLLIPEGTSSEEWTRELGRETATYLARLSDPIDKEKVSNLALSVLIDFFELGLSSLMRSLTSSGQPAPMNAPMSARTATATGTHSSAS